MINSILYIIKLIIIFLPFVLFQFFSSKLNYKKEVRHKQFVMPIASLVYFFIMFVFINKIYELTAYLGNIIDNFLNDGQSYQILNGIKGFFADLGVYIAIVIINILALLLFMFIKKILLLFFKGDFGPDTIRGQLVGILYEYDDYDDRWYLKKSSSQLRTFVKAAYYIVFIISAIALFVSYEMYCNEDLLQPFCPILAVVVMSEMAYFVSGLSKDESESTLVVNADNSRRISMYALLRKPLAKLFGDKLSSEGTTINVGGQSGGAAEDILASIEADGGHIGDNYAAFIRKKMDGGLAPNVDYLRSGYDLAKGKSLLFNTPFYDKLIPYAFYAVNRALLTDKKVLVVMGRHGTEDDLINWCQRGITSVTNVPNLYKISLLKSTKDAQEDGIDIGIISTSGVHNLDIHRANKDFLEKVGFVIIVEPSRLVTTAQIGLNLLVKCCGDDKKITFCSMDRNCDGLVDSLSHILMTNITEVSATEYPQGMSSFMCWKADGEHLQHRLFPGVSRYLGMGTELSFVALKNQVKQAVWYGGDVYPVLDAHWISKQYYYDFLRYANLPATQESFDKYFKTSFNMCNEGVNNNSYVTVEDDRNNLFEARRNFATIAREQGFVNVISSEYMLREYMSDNTAIFTADAKAIPYITADYARTKRNSVLSLCLLLCVENVLEEDLKRKLMLIGIEDDDLAGVLWREICTLLCATDSADTDKNGDPIIVVETKDNKRIVTFDKESTIIFKREYSIESGKFENMYAIENKEFASALLDDLQNAGYIAELESEDHYIGTELKGHVYQKYLPGQFFTLNGKYYEMIATTSDNRILVRRASEHINGRNYYRQLRDYTLKTIRNSEDMGALKTVNNIDIHYLYADFEVETKGYWELNSYNDFESGSRVEINAVPTRKYFNKQILKLDFSAMGELFTESVRKTLTVLLNEVFVTLFAENQPFISALTPGECQLPSTYSLDVEGIDESVDNCIFIVEDSQLDIGLLVAVERNIERIMQIISDYLLWYTKKAPNPVEDEVQNSDESLSGSDSDADADSDAGTDSEKVDSEKVDSEKVDSEKVDSEKADSEKVDSEKVDSEKVDSEKVDSEKVDSENTDAEEADENSEDSDDNQKAEEGADASAEGGEEASGLTDETDDKDKKPNIFVRFGRWIKSLFKGSKKDKPTDDEASESSTSDDTESTEESQEAEENPTNTENTSENSEDSKKEAEVTYSE